MLNLGDYWSCHVDLDIGLVLAANVVKEPLQHTRDLTTSLAWSLDRHLGHLSIAVRVPKTFVSYQDEASLKMAYVEALCQ